MLAQIKLREQIAEQFVDALSRGEIPWHACWQCGRPVNAITGKEYRGVNALNLSYWADELGYADPRWCTFKQAQDHGWQVRKGAKAAKVEYWACWDTVQKKLLSWSEVDKLLKADPGYERNLLLRSRIYSVFNGAQIEGIPALEKRQQTDIGAIRTHRDILIQNMGIGYREGGNQAYYSPGSDTVTLPPEGDFHDTYGYMATFLHECGHATGHPSRLNRDLSGGFGSESYAKEELRAEIASAFTAQSLGLTLTDVQLKQTMENHAAYIQSWAAALKNAPEELFRAIKCAEGISDYLLEMGEFAMEQAEDPERADAELDGASDAKATDYAAQHGMIVRRLTEQERSAAPEEYRQDANFEITYKGRLWYSKDATLENLKSLADYAIEDLQSPHAILELSGQYPWANREQLAEIAGGTRDGLTPVQIAVYARMEFSAGQMNSIRFAQAAGLPPEQIDLLAQPHFLPVQMDIIKAGFLAGMTQQQVESYAKPEIPVQQMLDAYWATLDGQGRETAAANTPTSPSEQKPALQWES